VTYHSSLVATIATLTSSRLELNRGNRLARFACDWTSRYAGKMRNRSNDISFILSVSTFMIDFIEMSRV
jgi:hypothetical protein